MVRWMGFALLFFLTACSSKTLVPVPTLASLPVEIQTIQAWETQHGILNSTAQTDEWQFFGQAGQAIRLRAITENATVTMRLSLRGQVLAEGDTIEFTLPENEVYRVSIWLVQGTYGEYDLGLSYPGQHNPNLPTPLPQVVGIPTPTPAYSDQGDFILRLEGTRDVPGLLTAVSPRHVYIFEGHANTIVTIEMIRVAGTLDPTITLFDPDGNPIATDDNSAGNGNARLLNIILPADGLYSIQAHGAGFYGDYTLRYIQGQVMLQSDPQPTPIPTSVAPYIVPTVGAALPEQRLEDHIPVIGELTHSGDFQRYSFTLNADDLLSISIRPYQESTIQPQFEVYGPDGVLVTSVQASTSGAAGAALVTGIPVIESGAYIILVTSEENTSGQFLISAGRGKSAFDVYQGEITANLRSTGTIQNRGERHIWQITLHPGDVITAAASPTGSGFDPIMELMTADGVILHRDDNSGANQAALIDLATISEPATYLIRVSDAQGENLGSYVLLWRYVNAAPTPTPIPDTITLLSVDDEVQEGQYQFYSFQGRAGQQVRVTVLAAPNSTLDPVAALLDINGMVLAEGDDSFGTLNPEFTVTLPADGTYTIRVNGYLSGGRFDLFVNWLV